MGTTDTSITVTLGGDVTLPLFVQALTGISDLLKILAKGAESEATDWVVENLEAGSAIALIRGHGNSVEAITSTTDALIDTIRLVDRGSSAVLDPRAARAAMKITRIVDGVVPFLSVASGDEEVSILSGENKQGQQRERVSSFGSVTGVVRTLSRTKGLYFTVSDETYNRTVACRFSPDLSATMADTMRELWDRRAVVEGTINRDRRTGRPITVSNVERVTPAPEWEPGAFMRARGVLSVSEETELPEETIRRLRDAS